jgi:hypothetical protein
MVVPERMSLAALRPTRRSWAPHSGRGAAFIQSMDAPRALSPRGFYGTVLVRDELAVIADVCFKLTAAVGNLLCGVRTDLNETQLH